MSEQAVSVSIPASAPIAAPERHTPSRRHPVVPIDEYLPGKVIRKKETFHSLIHDEKNLRIMLEQLARADAERVDAGEEGYATKLTTEELKLAAKLAAREIFMGVIDDYYDRKWTQAWMGITALGAGGVAAGVYFKLAATATALLGAYLGGLVLAIPVTAGYLQWKHSRVKARQLASLEDSGPDARVPHGIYKKTEKAITDISPDLMEYALLKARGLKGVSVSRGGRGGRWIVTRDDVPFPG